MTTTRPAAQATAGPHARWTGPSGRLNTTWHRRALLVFAVVVIAHWGEHLAQAVQIYVMGWPVPEAGGLLGLAVPWLVTSEWMHYGYALVMLIGLVTLRHGFTGRARRWWNASMWTQVWHHFEHLLLLLQASTGAYLAGAVKPTSIVQLLVPRVELHLFYNTLVTLPMVVAMVLHHRRTARDAQDVTVPACSCGTSVRRRAGLVAAG
ncbi:hypothetical protein [Geodermatophilus maliterrae]|uniref:Uncharacterized protein n=1 Tax=Geodermatophilus maliterrae TaxID=3162531 RepID=A0ABV3XCE0_9ACTN